jgi:hypothetical protein
MRAVCTAAWVVTRPSRVGRCCTTRHGGHQNCAGDVGALTGTYRKLQLGDGRHGACININGEDRIVLHSASAIASTTL